METRPSVSKGLHLLPKTLKTAVEGGMELRVQSSTASLVMQFVSFNPGQGTYMLGGLVSSQEK